MTNSLVSTHLHGMQQRIQLLNNTYSTDHANVTELDFRQWLPETCMPKKPEPKLISMAEYDMQHTIQTSVTQTSENIQEIICKPVSNEDMVESPTDVMSNEMKHMLREAESKKTILYYQQRQITQNRRQRKTYGSLQKELEREKNQEWIHDFSQLDELDKGKPWNRLDMWKKRQLMKQYLQAFLPEESNKAFTIKTYMKRLQEGDFKTKKQVAYDSQEGRILKLIEN